MSAFRIALRVLRVDQRTRASTVLTGLGVALATGLVLLLVGMPYATEARGERAAWQAPSGMSGDGASQATLSVATSEDVTDGREITRVDVATLADPSAVSLPAGIDRLPEPGETLLSPELDRLVDGAPAAQLGDRFGEATGVLGDDALRSPDQLVALVGHAPGDMPPTAAEQPGFTTDAQPDGSLTLLAGVGLVVLTVPSLVLVASSSRLIAARRERRLAVFRLAGATPRQVVAMVAAETTIAAAAGALVGAAASPLLHRLAATVPWDGGTWQPSDFGLPTTVTAAIVVAVPALVLLAAVLGLRRVLAAPFGAAGAHAPKPLHWWRLLPLPVAGALFVFLLGVTEDTGDPTPLLAVMGLLIGSFVLAGPWVTAAIGTLFVRTWRRPSMLLAGRRLRDDPRGAFRASAGVVLAVFTGTLALTILPSYESLAGVQTPYRDGVLTVETDRAEADRIVDDANAELARYGQDARATGLGTVFLSDGDTKQRALVADCRTAERVLRIDADEACAAEPGVSVPDGFSTDGVTVSAGIESDGASLGNVPEHAATWSREAAMPVVDPAVLPAEVTPQTVTVAVGSDAGNAAIVRTALSTAGGGAPIESPQASALSQDTVLSDLRRVTIIGLVVAALLAGCSAAIATAGSVLDRRRTFGALIAAGMPTRLLARALRAEAALPALVATVGAGVTGSLVGAGLFSLVEEASVLVSPWLFAPVVLGFGVAVLAASACTPALRRVRAEPLADD